MSNATPALAEIAPHPSPLPARAGRGRSKLRLTAGIFPRLRDLHLGVGHHQSAFVRQCHEFKTHVDGAHRAFGTATVDAGLNAALAALFHDLLIDLEDSRPVAIEFGAGALGEAQLGTTHIAALHSLTIHDR